MKAKEFLSTATTALITLTAALAVSVATISLAPEAHADEVRQYQVDFTNGVGVRLRTAPYVDAEGFPRESGMYAIPEGAWFPAECETFGDWVTNVYGESTNVYVRAPGGIYVSTAWLNTGTNSRVGLPLCDDKDAAMRASLSPKTVADYHREGYGSVWKLNDAQTSGRVYFSKDQTWMTAEALRDVDRWSSRASNVVCASVGVGVGVMTAGSSLAVGAAIGFGADIGCSAITGSTGESFERALAAASTAAHANACYEIWVYKDSDTGEWLANNWIMTAHSDYCA